MTCELYPSGYGMAIRYRNEQQSARSKNSGEFGETSDWVSYIFQDARTQDAVQ